MHDCFDAVVLTQPVFLLNFPSPNVFSVCFSSILRAMADTLVVRLGLSPAVRAAPTPVVGWMWRGGNAARARISNQKALMDEVCRPRPKRAP